MGQSRAVSADTLQQFDPINNLAHDQVEDLAEQLAVEAASSGYILFKAGDDAPISFYLLAGKVSLTGENGTTETVEAGSERALRPLGGGRPRRFQAEAITAVEYLRVDADLVDSMITWGQLATPEPEVVMSEDGIITIDKGSWLKKMVRSPTFKTLPPANVEALLDRLEPVRVQAGEVIIRQGDPGDYFYMIDQGNALVHRQTEAEEDESIELAELVEGSSFGEAALISDKPRNATVSMMSDGILLRLSKEDFLTLLNAPNVQNYAYEEAKERVAAGSSRWLDVRTASEFRTGHLKGAVNVPVQQLHRRSRELDRNVQYICCCDSGQRSAAGTFVLKQYGLDGVVLQNGLSQVPEIDLVTSD